MLRFFMCLVMHFNKISILIMQFYTVRTIFHSHTIFSCFPHLRVQCLKPCSWAMFHPINLDSLPYEWWCCNHWISSANHLKRIVFRFFIFHVFVKN